MKCARKHTIFKVPSDYHSMSEWSEVEWGKINNETKKKKLYLLIILCMSNQLQLITHLHIYMRLLYFIYSSTTKLGKYNRKAKFNT